MYTLFCAYETKAAKLLSRKSESCEDPDLGLEVFLGRFKALGFGFQGDLFGVWGSKALGFGFQGKLFGFRGVRLWFWFSGFLWGVKVLGC